MTAPAERSRHRAVIAVLAGTGAYPVAAAVHPPAEAAVWPLFVATLTAAAAAAGAGRTAPGWRAAAALAAVGAAADVGWRTLWRLAAGMPLDDGLAGAATLAVAGLVAGGWTTAARLAARMQHAVERSRPPGDVRPVGQALLAGGCVVLAAAGWAHWGAPDGAWRPPTVGLAVALYAGVTLWHLQRLRRSALQAGWARAGRAVQPEVAGHWNRWVGALLTALLVVVSLWWVPPAEPLRHGAREASPAAVARLRDYFGEAGLTREELQRGGRAAGGESMPSGTSSADEERRVIRVRSVVEWLLQPATGFDDVDPVDAAGDPPARWGVTPQLLVAVALVIGLALLVYRRLRRGNDRPSRSGRRLPAVAAWWARLWSALAALFRVRARAPAGGRGAADHTDDAALAPPRRSRRWLRPSTPREQVKYDYLRVLHRAERRGLPRHRALSPSAYARVLAPAVPDHADDVRDLTSRFVEARYSHHPIGASEAERTLAASRALRRALRDREPTQRR